jgi:hypothetical protein
LELNHRVKSAESLLASSTAVKKSPPLDKPLTACVDYVNTHFERARKAGAAILEEPRIRSTVIAAMVPKIQKAISGISRRRSLNV